MVVGAGVDEFAVTHDEDVVGVADGGESVGDDDAGAVVHEFGEGVLNEEFGRGVDAGGGFVEYEEQFGVLGEGTGHDEELFLTE